MMKPFSKNLFSQTCMAFGWLPKETINLDISVCVCVRTCAWACICVCEQLEYEWEIFFCYFVLSHTDTSMSRNRSIRKCVHVCKHATTQHPTPKLLAAKTQQRLITDPSFLSSVYTFTLTRSPNTTPKHPSMSTPLTPLPIPPKFRPA